MSLKNLDPELQEKLISRIQALLRLGDKDRNDNENEVNVAQKKAKELLDQYNLSLSEIMTSEDSKAIGNGIVDEVAEEYRKSSMSSWEGPLLAIVGESCECKPYIEKNYVPGSRSGKIWKMRFIGTQWDCAIAKELFVFLHKTLLRISRKTYPESIPDQGAFLIGATQRLSQRISAQTKAFKNQNIVNEKYALMVVSKKDAIEKYIEDNLKLTKKEARKQGIGFKNWGAYEHGKEVGSKIDIGIENRMSGTEAPSAKQIGE